MTAADSPGTASKTVINSQNNMFEGFPDGSWHNPDEEPGEEPPWWVVLLAMILLISLFILIFHLL